MKGFLLWGAMFWEMKVPEAEQKFTIILCVL